METCEVPCEAVDKKLEGIWIEIRKRVQWIVFTFVLGGLGLVLIFIGGSIMAKQDTLSGQVSSLSVKMETQNVVVSNMQEVIGDIKRELRRSNGGGK